jgi:hypothetical protein
MLLDAPVPLTRQELGSILVKGEGKDNPLRKTLFGENSALPKVLPAIRNHCLFLRSSERPMLLNRHYGTKSAFPFFTK